MTANGYLWQQLTYDDDPQTKQISYTLTTRCEQKEDPTDVVLIETQFKNVCYITYSVLFKYLKYNLGI